jgi:hypothetical protein
MLRSPYKGHLLTEGKSGPPTCGLRELFAERGPCTDRKCRMGGRKECRRVSDGEGKTACRITVMSERVGVRAGPSVTCTVWGRVDRKPACCTSGWSVVPIQSRGTIDNKRLWAHRKACPPHCAEGRRAGGSQHYCRPPACLPLDCPTVDWSAA